ncbi:MAG: CehA/McbA family metallohydrolase [bacterium]|nr:CehA/McbA family metallohydrolase [bacterium]
MKTPFVVGCFLLASLCSAQEPVSDDLHVISTRIWHPGIDPTPEWKEAPVEPEGFMVNVAFEARVFSGEGILFLKQRDVQNSWLLTLNGKPTTALKKCGDGMGEFRYVIPEGIIVDGENTLTLVGQIPTDDILFGDIRYSEESTRECFDLRQFALHVSHEVAGVQESIPARITIVDSKGELAEMFYASFEHVALRPGNLYTGTGHATAELPVGDYVVYASRGMEWSRAKVDLHLTAERPQTSVQTVELKLVHEVDTPGFVAADTHIHTLTHSGHGDASMDERQITLAGEGVELAIATDHNHNIDHRPTQKRMGLSAYYTPVVGNEVSTPIGHFNAFPLNSKDPVPLHESSDLKALLASMRSKGARTTILNHPRWPEGDKAPFNTIGLHSRTGFWKGPWASGCDVMELINSDIKEKDPLQLYRVWFSSMNKGDKVVSVGSSDSHKVGVVVGQGRTYVQSKISDVSRLDINECSDNIARGHSSVSMGMFADLTHEGKPVMGQLLGVDEGYRLPLNLELRFADPSWVDSERFIVFVNGQ